MSITKTQAVAEIEKGNPIEFKLPHANEWKLFIPQIGSFWGVFSNNANNYRVAREPWKKSFISEIGKESRSYLNNCSEETLLVAAKFYEKGYLTLGD